MDRPARIALGVISAIGLVLSLAVHISALLGIDAKTYVPSIWFLHLGVFFVFIPMVLFSWMDHGSMPTGNQLMNSLPKWAKFVGIGLALYTGINFLLFMAGTGGGSAQIQDGHYILSEHGKLIREITAREYAAYKVNEVRGFSGHWIFFYSVPTAFFLLGKKRAKSPVCA